MLLDEELPIGALTKDELRYLAGKPSSSGICRIRKYHMVSKLDGFLNSPYQYFELQFNSGRSYYYFDNYFHALACSLRIRARWNYDQES